MQEKLGPGADARKYHPGKIIFPRKLANACICICSSHRRPNNSSGTSSAGHLRKMWYCCKLGTLYGIRKTVSSVKTCSSSVSAARCYLSGLPAWMQKKQQPAVIQTTAHDRYAGYTFTIWPSPSLAILYRMWFLCKRILGRTWP